MRAEMSAIRAMRLNKGDLVDYVGTQVKHHIGKRAEVVGFKPNNGVELKSADGVVGSANGRNLALAR